MVAWLVYLLCPLLLCWPGYPETNLLRWLCHFLAIPTQRYGCPLRTHAAIFTAMLWVQLRKSTPDVPVELQYVRFETNHNVVSVRKLPGFLGIHRIPRWIRLSTGGGNTLHSSRGGLWNLGIWCSHLDARLLVCSPVLVVLLEHDIEAGSASTQGSLKRFKGQRHNVSGMSAVRLYIQWGFQLRRMCTVPVMSWKQESEHQPLKQNSCVGILSIFVSWGMWGRVGSNLGRWARLSVLKRMTLGVRQVELQMYPMESRCDVRPNGK